MESLAVNKGIYLLLRTTSVGAPSREKVLGKAPEKIFEKI